MGRSLDRLYTVPRPFLAGTTLARLNLFRLLATGFERLRGFGVVLLITQILTQLHHKSTRNIIEIFYVGACAWHAQ